MLNVPLDGDVICHCAAGLAGRPCKHMGTIRIVLQLTHAANTAQEKALWSNGAAKPAPTRTTAPVPRLSFQPAKPEHWCAAHSATFQRHERHGKVWYSHKADGKWCNEDQGKPV